MQKMPDNISDRNINQLLLCPQLIYKDSQMFSGLAQLDNLIIDEIGILEHRNTHISQTSLSVLLRQAKLALSKDSIIIDTHELMREFYKLLATKYNSTYLTCPIIKAGNNSRITVNGILGIRFESGVPFNIIVSTVLDEQTIYSPRILVQIAGAIRYLDYYCKTKTIPSYISYLNIDTNNKSINMVSLPINLEIFKKAQNFILQISANRFNKLYNSDHCKNCKHSKMLFGKITPCILTERIEND